MPVHPASTTAPVASGWKSTAPGQPGADHAGVAATSAVSSERAIDDLDESIGGSLLSDVSDGERLDAVAPRVQKIAATSRTIFCANPAQQRSQRSPAIASA